MSFIRKVLLIIGGGIAAYKVLDLIRQLRRSGVEVTPLLTSAARNFVTPLSVAAIANCEVRESLFDLDEESSIDHIQLSRQSDLLVVAPATADLLAKMANGLADDLASTVLLATDKPILVAPAMNVRMWTHRATQRNVAQLKSDGVKFVGPAEGEMACGEFGLGRMSESEEIFESIDQQFIAGKLSNKHILVTSGPTWEAIDPVRIIANRSSGRQGTEIAAALLKLGAKVTFVTGPVALEPPTNAAVVRVESADEMLEAVERTLPADAAVFTAAVADWKPKAFPSKIKKSRGSMPVLEFTESPDILATIASRSESRPKLVVGFAAETENVLANAKAKLKGKGCDWIIANDVSTESGILGGDENQPVIISVEDEKRFPRMRKSEFAQLLADLIAERLAKI